ncbi:uncharacterized protein K489DRAFT_30959 [Dissoconium aciculare CBS 342.82]|uniref:Uncharacterized protein n=1 Tax=Dissoconium aciculare CBS 342.82 TaxID=1314786 RepID=A0A6J3MIZ5_9PEZI|nr:uncharacterized protein K489DRAFT_30959 [Dissoconium aciculare CBS 342.82]KAF1827883.1 hypothetical protein K489DRAFT_30959 [Dissoconium aciculare CBS 342.82]
MRTAVIILHTPPSVTHMSACLSACLPKRDFLYLSSFFLDLFYCVAYFTPPSTTNSTSTTHITSNQDRSCRYYIDNPRSSPCQPTNTTRTSPSSPKLATDAKSYSLSHFSSQTHNVLASTRHSHSSVSSECWPHIPTPITIQTHRLRTCSSGHNIYGFYNFACQSTTQARSLHRFGTTREYVTRPADSIQFLYAGLSIRHPFNDHAPIHFGPRLLQFFGRHQCRPSVLS